MGCKLSKQKEDINRVRNKDELGESSALLAE